MSIGPGSHGTFNPNTIAALHAGFVIDEPTREKTGSPKPVSRFGNLYGESEPMQRLFDLIAKVAPTRATVFISGESGTGKEVVASTIHELSKQRGKPFIAVNCGAIPANLIEAELFGHERGSFTGAVRMHKGCFERAAEGTLFLDEVTEMPLDMQVKLLRVLETGRFCRVGGDGEIEARVRVIAATNRCPAQAAQAGILRADLLYRLAVFPIEMPRLRDRGDDVELLAQIFLDQLNDEEVTHKKFSAASRRFLREHRWPGNVRELKNVVQRAFILADDVLDISSAVGTSKPVPAEGLENCVAVQLGSRLADAERSLIFATLDHCRGNKTRAAEVLGVSLKTLYNRLNEYHANAAQTDCRGLALS
jgi:DNA-binding NtrC family response regulator